VKAIPRHGQTVFPAFENWRAVGYDITKTVTERPIRVFRLWLRQTVRRLMQPLQTLRAFSSPALQIASSLITRASVSVDQRLWCVF